MKKMIAVVCGLLVPLMAAAAGGQAMSGRDAAEVTAESGQFINPDSVDAYGYINDYEFPYALLPGADLSVYVRLEKELALSAGDNFNLLIGLRVNEQEFFGRRPGNYVLFIHNPGLLRETEWRNRITQVLSRIRTAQAQTAVLGIFDPATRAILTIPNAAAIGPALDKIVAGRKVYDNTEILDGSFACMDAIGNSFSTRFIWITDSNLLRGTGAAREKEYFDYLINLQSQNNISFSYLGYGETPDWALMNESLKNAGGNSYYVNSAGELEDTVWGDYNRFNYPTVENVKITVSLAPWIRSKPNDFRPEWYPASNFTPTSAYYANSVTHTVKNLDPGDHRIFLHYLSIPAENRAAEDLYFRSVVKDRVVPAGFVGVEYYSFHDGKTKYSVFPLEIEFTDDYDTYGQYIDYGVRKFSILQNTPFILKELSQLVNKRAYYQAILLVDSQIKLLEDLYEEKPDNEIEGDIETLKRNRDLLMEQARSLNYIR